MKKNNSLERNITNLFRKELQAIEQRLTFKIVASMFVLAITCAVILKLI